jgi:hypothetical protein
MPPAAALAAVIFTSLAQDPAPNIGAWLQSNQDALQAYTHKRRTEITIKGRTRSRLDEIRYLEGETHVTPLEPAGANPRPRLRTGPVARKRVEKKAKQMREDAQQLTALLQQYLRPAPALLEKAHIERNGTSAKLTAQDVVRPKDSFTLTFDPGARQPQTISIRTDLDGKPVTMDVSFARLPDGGPFYPAVATIAQPKTELRIRVENFDYTK